VCVRIRNSAIESTGGRIANPPSIRFPFFAPSSRKLFDSGRCPFTEYACPARSEPPAVANPFVNSATPACSRPNCVKFRPFNGKSRISFSVTVLPIALLTVSASGASLVTLTDSRAPATSIRTSIRITWLTCTSSGFRS